MFGSETKTLHINISVPMQIFKTSLCSTISGKCFHVPLLSWCVFLRIGTESDCC